jgi:hypothetical protein
MVAQNKNQAKELARQQKHEAAASTSKRHVTLTHLLSIIDG